MMERGAAQFPARIVVLRRIIGNTAHIVAAAGLFPMKEMDVQNALKEAIPLGKHTRYAPRKTQAKL